MRTPLGYETMNEIITAFGCDSKLQSNPSIPVEFDIVWLVIDELCTL